MAICINQNKHLELIFLFLNVLLFATASEEACKKWTQMASDMTGSGKIQTCKSASPPNCTRLDCTGAVRFSRQFILPGSSKDPIEIKYCFGAQLLSCVQPVSMDFYLQLPGSKYKKAFRVNEDRNIDLSDVKISLGQVGTASPQLDFKFERRADGDIKISVISKVKVSNNIINRPFFIDGLKRTLIDEEIIHASVCPNGTVWLTSNEPDPSFMPNDCTPPAYKSVTTQTPAATKPPASATLNKTCNIFDLVCGHGEICDSSDPPHCVCNADTQLSSDGTVCEEQTTLYQPCKAEDDCGVNELCQKDNNNKFICQCGSGNQYDSTRHICVRPSPGNHDTSAKPGMGPVPMTPSSPMKPSKPSKKSGSKDKKGNSSTYNATAEAHSKDKTGTDPSVASYDSKGKLPIIIGGTVGGFILLSAVVAANVYLFRRYRRQQQNGGSGLMSESDTTLLEVDDDSNLIM